MLGIAGVGTMILIPLAIGALAVTDLGEYFWSRLSFQGYDADRFGAQRLAIDVSGTKLLGIGPGQWTWPRYHTDTHNLYLRILVENGVFGFLGCLIFSIPLTLYLSPTIAAAIYNSCILPALEAWDDAADAVDHQKKQRL